MRKILYPAMALLFFACSLNEKGVDLPEGGERSSSSAEELLSSSANETVSSATETNSSAVVLSSSIAVSSSSHTPIPAPFNTGRRWKFVPLDPLSVRDSMVLEMNGDTLSGKMWLRGGLDSNTLSNHVWNSTGFAGDGYAHRNYLQNFSNHIEIIDNVTISDSYYFSHVGVWEGPYVWKLESAQTL